MVRTGPIVPIVEGQAILPADGASVAPPKVEIHPFSEQGGLIIKIEPPKQPSAPALEHVPCDIVLVIDVSSSMGDEAPVPGDTTERTGLTILDLTKHAARTIMATLRQKDRLGIVTFDSTAKVCQPLIPMTLKNKKATDQIIESMMPGSMTNLWSGITQGLALFNNDDVQETANVPALMVLTDGQPNHMHPQPGYIPKLRKMQPFRPSIHTFGFGYRLRSGLLKSISEVSGGNYAFIPDAGMIGTVFVHAIANLQSTFATETTLRLVYPRSVDLEETTGASAQSKAPEDWDTEHTQLSISLGNLQYGQSREIYFKCLQQHALDTVPIIHAFLEYRRQGMDVRRPGVQRSISETTDMSLQEIAYHVSRSAIVSYLASIHPLDYVDEHKPPTKLTEEMTARLQTLIENLPARQYPDDPRNNSLVLDLIGEEPRGQISMALASPLNYSRWGIHYLPSLGGAHARQICNSFRDPGPLIHGSESPLFIQCRDDLDMAFESIPAPKPTKKPTLKYANNFSMRTYHSRDFDTPCFAACSMVELSKEVYGDAMGGGKMIPVSRLRTGMSVRTPKGPRRVVAVLRTPVRRLRMCLVGDLIVTAWHPISLDGKVWTFPTHIAKRSVWYTGSIYSVLLQRDQDIDAAALMIGGLWGVTLGHGLLIDTASTPDPRAHTFFGDYSGVIKSLSGLHRTRNGLFLSGGVRRDQQTGLVDGFRRSPSPVRFPSKRKAICVSV